MKQKTLDAVRVAAGPSLEPGEQVQLIGSAMAGTLSASRMLAQATVVTVLTAGTLTAVSRPRKFYVALTDRRLLFLGQHALSGQPTTSLAMQVARPALTVLDVRIKRTMLLIPTLRVQLAVRGSDKGLNLTFPTVAISEGRQFAEALAVTA